VTSTLGDFEALPFVPGASPFRIKGVVYRAHVEYAREFIPGGERGVIDAFRTAGLRAFYEQQFLASTWYDILPIIPVWTVCARLTGQTMTEFLKARTRHQALQDINGVYRLLLKIASAEMVALRMPRVTGQYFDFGTTTANVLRPGVVRIERQGIPALIVPWFTIVGETYLAVALELAGGKSQIRRHPTVQTGEAHGVPLCTMGCDVFLDGA
jgi:hypothetical protein